MTTIQPGEQPSELYGELRGLYDALATRITPPDTADGFNVDVPVPMLGGDVVIGANNIKHRQDIKWGSATLAAVGHEAGLSIVVDRVRDHSYGLRRVGLVVSYLAGDKAPVFTNPDVPEVFDGFFLDCMTDGRAELSGLSDGRMYEPRHAVHHANLFIVATMRALQHVRAGRARAVREARNVSAA